MGTAKEIILFTNDGCRVDVAVNASPIRFKAANYERKFRRYCYGQGCSLGLKRLGLESVSRYFLERLVSSRS